MIDEALEVSEGRNEQDKINYLLYKIFHTTEDGKELLKYLKKIFLEFSVLPVYPNVIEQFGSIEIFMAFKAGQANLIKWIEQGIFSHREGKG
jgi:hypothetical protein